MKPFAKLLGQEKQREHKQPLPCLLSNVERKNVESIAFEHDQDRQILQHLMGQAMREDVPLRGELARQIGRELGEFNGELVFDPTRFPKKGRKSVGVYLAFVARREHALVDVRLYLPKEWTEDKQRRNAGVPSEQSWRNVRLGCSSIWPQRRDEPARGQRHSKNHVRNLVRQARRGLTYATLPPQTLATEVQNTSLRLDARSDQPLSS